MLRSMLLAALVIGGVPVATQGADKRLSGAEIAAQIVGKVFRGNGGYDRCNTFKLTFGDGGQFTYLCEQPFNLTASADVYATVHGKWFVGDNQLCTEDRLRGRHCAPVVNSGGTLRWTGGKFR